MEQNNFQKRILRFETASNIFIQSRALLEHIQIHHMDASFTNLKQGPFSLNTFIISNFCLKFSILMRMAFCSLFP
jgi:hypothetical protein